MRKPIVNSSVAGCWLLIAVGVALGADVKKAEKLKPIKPEAVKLGHPVDFERDIYPILDTNCIACHNLAVNESEFILEDVESILKGGKRGASVVAKNPEGSLLYQLASRSKKPAMPPLPNDSDANALTPKELGLLRQWILEGATQSPRVATQSPRVATRGLSGDSKNLVQWQALPSGLNVIYSAALSPWGRFAASGRANQIAIYDLATGGTAARLIDPALSSVKRDGNLLYPFGAAHRDFVHTLAFSPDGTVLASGGYRVVKLWQRANNVRRLQIPTAGTVTSLAVSADGTWAAVGAAGGSIKLWNLNDGKPGKTLAGHTAPVTGLHFWPTALEKAHVDQVVAESKLYSSSLDKSIRVWDVASGALVGRIDTPAAVNDVTVNKDATQIISAGADNLLRVWKAPTGPEGKQAQATAPAIRQIPGHGKPVTSVALILPAGTQVVSGSEDGTVRIWDLNNGKQIRSMNHGGPVRAVTARPDGQMVASAGANNIGKLWQTRDGKQVAELKGNLHLGHQVQSITEQQTVAKQKVSLADGGFKAAEKNLKDREDAAKKAKDAKTAADTALAEAQKKAKSATGALTAAKAASAKKKGDKGLQKKVTDAEKANSAATAAVKKAVERQATAGQSLRSAGKLVATAKQELSQAKTRKDAATAHQKKVDARLAEAKKAETAAAKPLGAIAFSTDGKTLVTSGDDGIVHVWSGQTGLPREILTGHKGPVAAVAFASNNTLVSGSADKTVAVWDVNPKWKLIGQLGPQKDSPADLSTSAFVNRVLSLDFSQDGKLLVTGGGDPSRSGELMIWDVQKRSLVREIKDAHSDTIFGVEFSRDGKYILSGAADKFVKIFEVATGKQVRSFEGHTHHVMDVTWKADGSSIASAGADNVIKVWNAETGEQRRTIGGYSKQVTAIQYVGVGENIISCGGDKTVRFHRTGNGQNFRNFGGGTDFMYAAAASRDESVVIAGGQDGVLRVWNGTNGKVIAAFAPPKPPGIPQKDNSQASVSVPRNK